MTLCDAQYKKDYFINDVTAQEPIKSRLISMGFLKGNKLTVTDFTLTKQTYKVVIDDVKLAIRKEEAENIILGEF